MTKYMVEFEENIKGRHPSTLAVLQWFRWEYLREDLQETAEAFAELAVDMVMMYPDGPELTAGLRRLLDAKDCMVRCAVLLAKSRETPESSTVESVK